MITFGSVCSGIEAAHIALSSSKYKQLWSSEISPFPTKVLKHHYPEVPNLGDMNLLPELIEKEIISSPDMLCGGTPCQAFSLAGWKNGLEDERGQLTMKFIDIANSIDSVRLKQKKDKAIIFWENVEGVLNNKTNAFGNFLAGLAGLEKELTVKKWTKSGYIEGPTRNVAWRVLDAKFFGLPQQRKRLYVLAGGKDFRPDFVLFEQNNKDISKNYKATKKTQRKEQLSLFSQTQSIKESPKLVVNKDGFKFEFFREHTDCLYAAYGTKWNGNAAAYNGSLYIAQNDKVRRLTPLECERLMGFPDNYTLIEGSKATTRYQAIGNSWAIPVISWIGNRLSNYNKKDKSYNWTQLLHPIQKDSTHKLFLFENTPLLTPGLYLNTSLMPNEPKFGELIDIIQSEDIPEKLYLSSKARKGILRRKGERKINMNSRLENLMAQE